MEKKIDKKKQKKDINEIAFSIVEKATKEKPSPKEKPPSKKEN